MKILITGGAGFIGSQLAKFQAEAGADVTVLDNLSPQIHGPDADFPPSLIERVRCVKGDIRDCDLLKDLLVDRELVVHLAAETGTGQSMYAVERYSLVNIQGTAALIDTIVNQKPRNLSKLIVASSRAVYGEGEYRCAVHGRVFPGPRDVADMEVGQFEPKCPICGEQGTPLPTTEGAPFGPTSFYGLTKQTQEQMVLMFSQTLKIDGFALRYQNVYGPGQSLTNPYTGILAIFSNLVRQGRRLNIFEDGLESRDFVYIDDVVAATAACAAAETHGNMAINVGSGMRVSVLEVARKIVQYFNISVGVDVTGAFRLGDIRHNFADISRLSKLTGFAPRYTFADGLERFLSWARENEFADAGFDHSLSELKDRGLMGSSKLAMDRS